MRAAGVDLDISEVMRHRDDAWPNPFGDPRPRDEITDAGLNANEIAAAIAIRFASSVEIHSGFECEISYSHFTGDRV